MFCAHCGSEIKEGGKFCTACGNSVASPPTSSSLSDRRGEEPSVGHYRKVRRYTCDEPAFEALIPMLTDRLASQDFRCQQLKTEEGQTLVQISKKGWWRNVIGMSTALNVLLDHDGGALTVEIGAGRWIDKAAAAAGTAAVVVIFKFPYLLTLAVVPAIGAWKQAKMPEKIFDFIELQLQR